MGGLKTPWKRNKWFFSRIRGGMRLLAEVHWVPLPSSRTKKIHLSKDHHVKISLSWQLSFPMQGCQSPASITWTNSWLIWMFLHIEEIVYNIVKRNLGGREGAQEEIRQGCSCLCLQTPAVPPALWLIFLSQGNPGPPGPAGAPGGVGLQVTPDPPFPPFPWPVHCGAQWSHQSPQLHKLWLSWN